MKESISIQNLGPIQDIEIENIRPLTVFVGKSGSGKSTVLKTVALFRWIFKMACIRSFLKLSGVDSSPFTFDFGTYLKNNGMEDFVNDSTCIVYKKGECEISYTKKGLKVGNITDWDDISLEKISFISDKRNMIPEILQRNGDQKNLNFFLRESLDDYKKATEVVKKLQIDCLDVKFEVEKGQNSRDRYKITGEAENGIYSINLTDSSSGTQTVTPLSVIMEYFTHYYDLVAALNKAIFHILSISDRLSQFKGQKDLGSISSKFVNFHIEEPELSLYPTSQCQLIDFIINNCFNRQDRECDFTVMLATHSPYIVNYLNLLTIRAKNGITSEANLSLEDMDVFEIYNGYLNDLKQEDIFDTRLLSDPIEEIYSQYHDINK